MKMNNFKRMEKVEKQFKKRYNRDTEISMKQQNNGSNMTMTAKVKYKDKEFLLIDDMKEGRTVSAYIEYDDKRHKYARYVDAEIHLADIIGELEDKSGSSN